LEETGVPEENHQPVASHWQTLSLIIPGVSKWAGTFTRLRSCIVPAEITEPPQNLRWSKSQVRLACGIFFIKN
jgi:hypothetical protein